jgi:hypothetical protein
MECKIISHIVKSGYHATSQHTGNNQVLDGTLLKLFMRRELNGLHQSAAIMSMKLGLTQNQRKTGRVLRAIRTFAIRIFADGEFRPSLHSFRFIARNDKTQVRLDPNCHELSNQPRDASLSRTRRGLSPNNSAHGTTIQTDLICPDSNSEFWHNSLPSSVAHFSERYALKYCPSFSIG